MPLNIHQWIPLVLLIAVALAVCLIPNPPNRSEIGDAPLCPYHISTPTCPYQTDR